MRPTTALIGKPESPVSLPWSRDLAAGGDNDTRLVIEQDDSLVSYDNQQLIEAARATGQRDTLHYEHRRAHEEALLALPDMAAWCWVRSAEWRRRIGPILANVRQIGL